MSSPSSVAASRVGIIFRKEFREIFRDKRTIMSVVVGPIVITPLMFAIIGFAIQKKVEGANTTRYPIGYLGKTEQSDLLQKLKASPSLALQEVKTEAEATDLIRTRKVGAVVKVNENEASQQLLEQPVEVTLIGDKGEETSRTVQGKILQLIEKNGKDIVQQRLALRGVAPTILTPYTIKEKSIPGSGGNAMLFLTQMLPYILIMAAFSGAIYAAFDQVAGEKERGTLETLLISPASRRDIVLGKFGAVVSVCLVSCILSIVGLIIPFKSGLKAFSWLAEGGLSVSPTTLGVIALVLIPLSILFAGMLLAISTFARNQKEAQTYLGSLFPIVMIPAFFSMFMDAKVSLSVALVPILNGSLIIKQALDGSFSTSFITLAFAASVAYAGVAIGFATKMFQNESVLIKS
jgi:sodium transport system permease protein